MKPSQTIASCKTPTGATLECIEHDGDTYLYVDRQPICSTRAYEPEAALARAGCSRISQYRNPKILLAGLGLGHCLHELLSLAPPKAEIFLSEPIKDVIQWNRSLLKHENQLALKDSRLAIHTQSIAALLKAASFKFDAIMISNDPDMERAANSTLRLCASNLNPKGLLCIKSTRNDASRIQSILRKGGLPMTTSAPIGARPGARTKTHAIISAATRNEYLPYSN